MLDISVAPDASIVWDDWGDGGLVETTSPYVRGVVRRDAVGGLSDIDWCGLDGVRSWRGRMGCRCVWCDHSMSEAWEAAIERWGEGDARVDRYLSMFFGVKPVRMVGANGDWAEVLLDVSQPDSDAYTEFDWLIDCLNGEVFGVGVGITVGDGVRVLEDTMMYGHYGEDNALAEVEEALYRLSEDDVRELLETASAEAYAGVDAAWNQVRRVQKACRELIGA